MTVLIFMEQRVREGIIMTVRMIATMMKRTIMVMVMAVMVMIIRGGGSGGSGEEVMHGGWDE